MVIAIAPSNSAEQQRELADSLTPPLAPPPAFRPPAHSSLGPHTLHTQRLRPGVGPWDHGTWVADQPQCTRSAKRYIGRIEVRARFRSNSPRSMGGMLTHQLVSRVLAGHQAVSGANAMDIFDRTHETCVRCEARGAGVSLLCNAHMDVSQSQQDRFCFL